MANYINFVDKKLEFCERHVILPVLIIGSIALFLRLNFFVPEIPITQDATNYFWYANDVSILKNFPSHSPANAGWPIFLSFFFSIFYFDNFLDYTILQRMITISISVLTIIPVYFLCTRFFDKSYSLMGAALFAFEPHLIQNSLRGLTEPLYILVGISALFLFLSTNKKVMYTSFTIAAFFSLIRSEGIILFLVFSIMFFLRYKKEKKVIRKYLLALSIFVIILLPVIAIRIQSGGDIFFPRIVEYANVVQTGNEDSNEPYLPNFTMGAETLAKRIGQSMIPYFAFFVPFGSLLILRNRNQNNMLIVLTIIIYLIVTFRIFSSGNASDIRLIFFLYPLFGILSVFTIKILGDTLNNRSLFLVLLAAGLILLSWFFLYSNNVDITHEREALKLAYYVAHNTKVINNYYPESGYLPISSWSDLPFPILSSNAPYTGPIPLDYIERQVDSLEDYIKLGRKSGLTHLVLDDNKNRPFIYQDAFYNEKKYPYLIKEFDSFETGFKQYHAKVFKIDYDKFNSSQNK